MGFRFLMKNSTKSKKNIFPFLNFKGISIALLTITSLPLLAEDLSLISVVISRNGNVSYIYLSPLHYEAQKKDFKHIQISPQDSQRDRPMELILYSTCNRGNPQQESVLGFRAQFLMVSFLLSQHPDDKRAAYYLFPNAWFRMLKEGIRGHPHFQEEGIIRMAGVHNKLWEVNIERSDVTGIANPNKDYSISFSKDSDQPLFIQALLAAAKPSAEGIPQVTLILESPRLYIRATYNLIHKGARQYQPIQKMNLMEWWRKQLSWCPLK